MLTMLIATYMRDNLIEKQHIIFYSKFLFMKEIHKSYIFSKHDKMGKFSSFTFLLNWGLRFYNCSLIRTLSSKHLPFLPQLPGGFTVIQTRSNILNITSAPFIESTFAEFSDCMLLNQFVLLVTRIHISVVFRRASSLFGEPKNCF